MASVQVVSPTELELRNAKRYYVSESSRAYKYLLPADEEERERLNLQSQAIIQLFDNKLIWAPITLKDGDIVLDSGTGSGHWLLSLAKERDSDNSIPSIHLRGIDISPRMFPPLFLTYPNTTFTPQSITSLPPTWTSTISLIHQRLLCVALQSSQWASALSEMHRVLVPGGWIQLFEPNHVFVSPLEAIVKHKAFEMRDKMCFEIRHVMVDIVEHLPGLLEKAGFINLKIEKRGLPMGSWAGEFGVISARSTMNFWLAIKRPVLEEGLVKSEEEYDGLVEDLVKLCEETPETYFEYWVFTAQKPVA